VNSVKAHLGVTQWLGEAKPDVCLQKSNVRARFSFVGLRGYGLPAVFGQKTYNGVAILSKYPLENVVRGLPGDISDEQSRYIQATVMDGSRSVTVASVYSPNGNPTDSPKYTYKLEWMDRLIAHAKGLLKLEERSCGW
jgi:exodeoxyribonuclease-3